MPISFTNYLDVPEGWEPQWIIEDLVADKGTTIINGAAKSHKSFLRRQIVGCLLTGSPLFGKYKLQREIDHILIVISEDVAGAERKFGDIIHKELGGVDWSKKKLTIAKAQPFDLMNQKDLDQLLKWIDEAKPDFIVLDPLRNYHKLDENNSESASQIMGVLNQIAETVPILLIHHTPKGQNDSEKFAEIDAAESGRGSGAWGGHAMEILSLRVSRNGLNHTIKKTGKYDASPSTFSVRLSTETWLWSLVEPLTEAFLLQHLKDYPDIAVGRRRDLLGCQKTRLVKMLDELVESGQIGVKQVGQAKFHYLKPFV